MKNLIIIDELRGIDIPAGSEIQYNPQEDIYTYKYEEKTDNMTSCKVYRYSPDFFEPYIKSGKVQEIGENKQIKKTISNTYRVSYPFFAPMLSYHDLPRILKYSWF